MLEEALVYRRVDSPRSGKELLTPDRRLRLGAMVFGLVEGSLVEKAGLYQEPRIDADPVLEPKFVTRSVKTIRMPVKTVLQASPAHPPALSRVDARFPLGLLALESRHLRKGQLPVILLARWGEPVTQHVPRCDHMALAPAVTKV